jgi:hypothetical protein
MVPVVPFFKSHGLKLVLWGVVLYSMFFVNLGTRTLSAHIVRILGTPEARECGAEIVSTLGAATNAVSRRISGAIASSR